MFIFLFSEGDDSIALNIRSNREKAQQQTWFNFLVALSYSYYVMHVHALSGKVRPALAGRSSVALVLPGNHIPQ